MPWPNYLANADFAMIASILFHRRLSDLYSGMRAYRKSFLGQTEDEVGDRVHRTGAQAIQAARDGRKEGGPRVEDELPGLPRGGRVRRLPAPDGAQPALLGAVWA